MTGGARPVPRVPRVAETLREVLADAIERLADPRLGFVTITGVDLSPDFALARVYYSVLGGAEQDEQDEQEERTRAALRAAAPRLRSRIGAQVRLKRVPRLEFRLDPAVEAGRRVEAALRTIGASPAAGDPGRRGVGDGTDVGEGR